MIEKNVDGVITKFFYNLEDRLERVEDSSGNIIATYYYDPFGRRLSKEVDGTRTYFHYSDEGLIGEYNAAGAEIKSYGWKPGSTWGTDPVFMKVGGEYYWYHNDHLGTPQVMTTLSGAIVWSAKYTSFGKASIEVGSTVVSPLRLSGQYKDDETGLYYNYFRYYNPINGSYNREDEFDYFLVKLSASVFISTLRLNAPATYSTEEKLNSISNAIIEDQYLRLPQDSHLFNFVGNNPTNWIDPFGLKRSKCSKKDRCISNCLQRNYGDLYTWASALSPLSLLSAGYKVGSHFTSISLKRQGLIGLHTNYRTGKRLLRTFSQFGRFNVVSGLVGAFALGFQGGAYGYCYFSCL